MRHRLRRQRVRVLVIFELRLVVRFVRHAIMPKWPWPERLNAITLLSPFLRHWSASSMATQMAWATWARDDPLRLQELHRGVERHSCLRPEKEAV